MKRILPKSLIDLAKSELRDSIISRISKEINESQCWHLKSVDGSKIVDAVCHFRDRGKSRIFFKAKRLVFELIKGDLPEGFAVYSSCKKNTALTQTAITRQLLMTTLVF